MSDILTLKDTAQYLRVTKQTVYNMVKKGRIKAYKVGREWRFFRSNIMEYLESTSRNRILSTKDEEANKDKKGRMEALIEKKAQMKLEFTNKLRFLSDRATEALEVFSQPGFSTALDQALREALGAEEPPPQEGEGGGDGAASGPGAGAPDGAETGPEDGGAPP